MENEKTTIEYNRKSDFQKKYTAGQKANGETVLKEITLRSDIKEGLMEEVIEGLILYDKLCKKSHIRNVSMYEAGFEPKYE